MVFFTYLTLRELIIIIGLLVYVGKLEGVVFLIENYNNNNNNNTNL